MAPGAPASAGHAASAPDAASALAEAWRVAWRAMALNRVHTTLTLLGIVAGVASVIVMLAIGCGAKEQVVRQMGAESGSENYDDQALIPCDTGRAARPRGCAVGRVGPPRTSACCCVMTTNLREFNL